MLNCTFWTRIGAGKGVSTTKVMGKNIFKEK
jgi:hypothetical protein